MNWPGFYNLSGLWLAALAAPLILFYFLKLRRPRLEIPSLALWRTVLNDNRVNSPFQRFKRNLLLFLQLALLLLLVLALMQPYINAAPERAEFLPVLIDCSASMGAVGEEDGRTRLDLAKERVRELIDNMLPDQQLSLIAFHSSARRLTDFTDNRRELHDALDRLTASDVASDMKDALRMTQALARGREFDKVVIYSDGNVPAEVDFELPFELNYQRLPPAGANAGVTAINARRAGAAGWDVFVRIETGDDADGSAAVELIQDGETVAANDVVLGENASRRLVFRVAAPQASAIEVRLKPEQADSLAADNVAFLDLPASRPLTVRAGSNLAAFRHALRSTQGVEVFPRTGAQPPESFDLLISDDAADVGTRASVSLFLGFVPDELRTLVSIQSGAASVVDWARGSSLLQHVLLTDVQFGDEPVSSEGVREGDFEDLGYEVLAYSTSGPLILRKRDGERLAYWLLFHPDRSTLPYRIGFPILVSNLVETAMQNASLADVDAARTGVLPPLKLQPDRDYRVTGPDGFEFDARSRSDGVLAGVPAARVGRYVVSTGGETAASSGASLLDTRETRLAGVERIQFEEGLAVEAATSEVKQDRPLWHWFALAGLVLLLVEWWFYQRRPGGAAA